jgi:glyoxylase-like metal-dependent hydrolase (beta-lactamase superfamily II)/rhodanese-related sulfurtransferase
MMHKSIDTATLRKWLSTGQPVTVLDIRADEDRSQWSIPGSLHIDAYKDLKEGRPGPLADALLPKAAPVVTICNMGRVSQTAADVLRARGFDALFLEGGMKSWSLAWNTASVPLAGGSSRIIQFRRSGKGCLSYLVSSKNEAIIIDASLPPEVYLNAAAELSTQIRYVVDTHIHADHLSRSRLLAERAGGELVLPMQKRVQFDFKPLAPGDSLSFGNETLRAVPTPGHTIESTSYLMNGKALFTGDTLFLAGVGRPDLHADKDAAQERAKLLFKSLKQLFSFDPEMLVLPAHAGEPIPFDGRPLFGRLGDVAGRLQDWLSSEEAFVERILQRLPPTPPNHQRIVELNEAGIMPEGDSPVPRGLNPPGGHHHLLAVRWSGSPLHPAGLAWPH